MPGAAAIDGKPLYRIEVHGKNLFYFYGDATAPVVMLVHFGMSGAFRAVKAPGPEPTGALHMRWVATGQPGYGCACDHAPALWHVRRVPRRRGQAQTQ
jgi:formamidopyrimidine-DNA glycosylase